MSRKGKKDFAYHLSRFLSVYLPGQRNVSENTVLSYKDTFKLILLFAKDEKKLLSNQLSISDLTRPFTGTRSRQGDRSPFRWTAGRNR